MHTPAHYNPQHKIYKLKSKLIKHFGQRIKFWQPSFRSDLVYSQELPAGQAVGAAFESAASHDKKLEEAGMVLCRYITDSLRETEEFPWPLSAGYYFSLKNTPRRKA